MRWIFLLLLTSCHPKLKPTDTSITRTVQYDQEIKQVIASDAENKRWARIYLQEIDAAMANDDIPAYVFFVGEFEKIPLEIVPKEFRGEPGYVKGPSELELFFRLRWFEQAILLYKQQSGEDK